MKHEIITYPITVQTKPVENRKSKVRIYDAQILDFGEITKFYIMSKSRREIKVYDHFDLEDIISITFNSHTYQTISTDTIKIGKENVPVIEAMCIA